MKKRRTLLFSLPVLLICITAGFAVRGYWRERADRDLLLAIKANDTQRALEALRAHADPNVHDQGEKAPALSAYLSRLWRQVRGIKPPASELALSALGLAVAKDNTVVAEALLARGAGDRAERVNTQNMDGIVWEPLTLPMIAVKNKNLPLVQSLLEHGWDANEVEAERQTALFYAADAATIKMLVTHGANINATDASEHTALYQHLKVEADGEIVNALLDLGAQDKSSLILAAWVYDPAPLRKMLDLGWKVDVHDDNGATPLMAALETKSLELDSALLLIQRGAQVNVRNNDGQTPLLIAADGGSHSRMHSQSPDVMTALLAHGAQIDAVDRDGLTPLMVAASNVRPALVQLLLKHGAQINMRTKKGETALSLARKSDRSDDQARLEVIEMLKRAGAKE